MAETTPEPPTGGELELQRLAGRQEEIGQLKFAATDRVETFGGPVVLIFENHALNAVIAPPGTRLGPQSGEEDIDQWRVKPVKEPKKTGNRSNVVKLTDLVTSLRGKIATWALDTQVDLVEQRGSEIEEDTSYEEAVAVKGFIDQLNEAKELQKELSEAELRKKLGQLSGNAVVIGTIKGEPVRGILSLEANSGAVIVSSVNRNPALGKVTTMRVPFKSISGISKAGW